MKDFLVFVSENKELFVMLFGILAWGSEKLYANLKSKDPDSHETKVMQYVNSAIGWVEKEMREKMPNNLTKEQAKELTDAAVEKAIDFMDNKTAEKIAQTKDVLTEKTNKEIERGRRRLQDFLGGLIKDVVQSKVSAKFKI